MHRKINHNILLNRLFSLFVIGLLLIPLMVTPMQKMIASSQFSLIRKIDKEDKQLETIVFTSDAFAGLAFEKQGREFRYNGYMYDIHTIIRDGGQVVVKALRDVKETRLLEAFGDDPDKDDSLVQGNSQIGFMPYFLVNSKKPDFAMITGKSAYYSIPNIALPDPVSGITVPPPRFI